MEISVLLAVASSPDSSRHAYGLVVREEGSGRVLMEAGAEVGEADESREVLPETVHTAAYRGLLEALRFVASHPEPIEQVTIVTGSHRLVNQLTGIEPVEVEGERGLHERAMMGLLSVDAWSIAAGDRAALRGAYERAERALAGGAASDEGRGGGVVRFTMELRADPGVRCPARTPPHVRYEFGPDTPGGLCVHAAFAALGAAMGEGGGEVECGRCGVGIGVVREG